MFKMEDIGLYLLALMLPIAVVTGKTKVMINFTFSKSIIMIAMKNLDSTQ